MLISPLLGGSNVITSYQRMWWLSQKWSKWGWLSLLCGWQLHNPVIPTRCVLLASSWAVGSLKHAPGLSRWWTADEVVKNLAGSCLVWKALWRLSPHSCWFLYRMFFTFWISMRSFCSAIVRYSRSVFTLKLSSVKNRLSIWEWVPKPGPILRSKQSHQILNHSRVHCCSLCWMPTLEGILPSV